MVCIIALKDNVHYYLILVWFFFCLIYSQISLCTCRKKKKRKKNHINQVKTMKMAALLCLCWSNLLFSGSSLCGNMNSYHLVQNVIVYISLWIWACHRYYEYFTPFTEYTCLCKILDNIQFWEVDSLWVQIVVFKFAI